VLTMVGVAGAWRGERVRRQLPTAARLCHRADCGVAL